LMTEVLEDAGVGAHGFDRYKVTNFRPAIGFRSTSNLTNVQPWRKENVSGRSPAY
jgi:hypothetical protein